MRWGIRFFVPRHRIGVMLVALNDEEHILMLRHVFHPRTPWGLPGGWLDRHESPAAGVLRELKEETGLTAVLDSIIQVDAMTQPPHIGIAFLGRVNPGSLALSKEIIEAGWFAPDNLPAPLLPFTEKAIQKAMGQKRGGNSRPT